jgi:hypothetical protein
MHSRTHSGGVPRRGIIHGEIKGSRTEEEVNANADVGSRDFKFGVTGLLLVIAVAVGLAILS